MNINFNQALAISLVILGVLVASTSQLTDLFGPIVTKDIVSLASLLSSMLAGILGVYTGQSGQLKAVRDMPGIDKIIVNKDANTTLAQLAISPVENKIEASAKDTAAVTATAIKGN